MLDTSRSLAMFRAISLIEGVSYVVLLGIAMPLKYLAGDAEAVAIVGRIHGGLFVLFVIGLISAARDHGWNRRDVSTVLIAGILPLGAFWLERQIRARQFPARS